MDRGVGRGMSPTLPQPRKSVVSGLAFTGQEAVGPLAQGSGKHPLRKLQSRCRGRRRPGALSNLTPLFTCKLLKLVRSCEYHFHSILEQPIYLRRGLRMTDALIIDGPSEDLDVFECPNCKETIDTSADVCRFCGAKVNHEAAQKAAHLLARVDQACSDASVLRYTAVTAFCLSAGVVIGLLRNPRFIQHVGFQNVLIGFCVLVLIASSPFPVWSLLWWSKNANLPSDDEDFQNARGMVRAAGSIATASLVTFGSLLWLVLILKSNHG